MATSNHVPTEELPGVNTGGNPLGAGLEPLLCRPGTVVRPTAPLDTADEAVDDGRDGDDCDKSDSVDVGVALVGCTCKWGGEGGDKVNDPVDNAGCEVAPELFHVCVLLTVLPPVLVVRTLPSLLSKTDGSCSVSTHCHNTKRSVAKHILGRACVHFDWYNTRNVGLKAHV